jgi:hypothetical protein
MLTLGINEKNDLFLNDLGNTETKTEIDAVLQNCQTAVQMIFKEAIYKQNDGTPAFETIWNGNPNFQQTEASIRQTILSVEGVTNISSYDFTSNENIFRYNVNIETIYGSTFLEGSLNV